MSRQARADAETQRGPAAPVRYVLPRASSPILNAVDVRLLAQAAIVGIFLLLFIGFLDLGRALLLPVVSAVIIGMILDPLAVHAKRYGVPRAIFATMIVLVIFAAAYLGLMVLADPVMDMVKDAPRIGAEIKQRFQSLQDNFGAIRYLQGIVFSGDERLKVDFSSMVSPVLGFLTPALGQLAIFFATLFLFVIDQGRLRRALILVFPGRDARLHAIQALKEINESLVRYIGAVTMINLGVGTVTAIGLYLLQFPNPIFWGIAAFICNFVAYIGPALMVLAFLVVGIITFPSVGYALLIPALFVLMTTVEGHFITPNVIGHRFKTSALAAFLSLSFWTWLWGPVGAFLSLPLLIIGAVIARHLLPSKQVGLPA